MGRTSDARQRLMDAAYDLIWEYSYGAVTVDAICERAGVKKGSFYYFFESKSDLAATAVDAWWSARALVMERIFHPEVPPLHRIRDYLDFVVERQLRSHQTTGHVLGCPLHALATEICTQDEHLRLKLQIILGNLGVYFQEAIVDAIALGQLEGNQHDFKARSLLAFYAGTLTQARICNDPESLRHLSRDALKLIGAREMPFLSFARQQPPLALSL